MRVFHREIEHFRVISKVNLSSPYLWACFHILIPSFSGIGKGRKFDLMHKRLIIVVFTGRSTENICNKQWGGFKKKERQDETQFTTKIGGKSSLGPSYFVW
jgi:hypothetical protein